MLLHVVNYDVMLDGSITPARGLKAQVAVPRGKSVRAVTWSGTLGEMKPVKYTTENRGGRQTLHLDLDEVASTDWPRSSFSDGHCVAAQHIATLCAPSLPDCHSESSGAESESLPCPAPDPLGRGSGK
jgi:hypothetical protein